MSIAIRVKSENGDYVTANGDSANLWIEPHNSNNQVYVGFNGKESAEAWDKVRNLINTGADWSWYIRDAAAISFELK